MIEVFTAHCVAMVCASALSMTQATEDSIKSRSEICGEVGRRAVESDIDPALAIAIAWTETRFSDATNSTSGATGPMQVIPRYWCKTKSRAGCDLIGAGLRAFSVYKRRTTIREALCRYGSGKSCRESAGGDRYARRVLGFYKRLKKRSRDACSVVGC